MVIREIPLCLLLGLLLAAGYGSACVPAQCLVCKDAEETLPDSCPLCSEPCVNVSQWPPACQKEVFINSTGSKVSEGDDITLTCVHDLPDLNLTFGWMKDGEKLLEGQNKSQLFLKNVLSDKRGQYSCSVNSSCGNFESSPHGVTVNNGSVLILIVCGVSAIALVLIMGVTMKCKLKRDNAKHKERMKQRAQDQQRANPAPFTPRES
uniref:uncharacterized protein n=1 Tax=Semicossyphus pulcher TaxID=241346 RepID=UPI0037E736AE